MVSPDASAGSISPTAPRPWRTALRPAGLVLLGFVVSVTALTVSMVRPFFYFMSVGPVGVTADRYVWTLLGIIPGVLLVARGFRILIWRSPVTSGIQRLGRVVCAAFVATIAWVPLAAATRATVTAACVEAFDARPHLLLLEASEAFGTLRRFTGDRASPVTVQSARAPWEWRGLRLDLPVQDAIVALDAMCLRGVERVTSTSGGSLEFDLVADTTSMPPGTERYACRRIAVEFAAGSENSSRSLSGNSGRSPGETPSGNTAARGAKKRPGRGKGCTT